MRILNYLPMKTTQTLFECLKIRKLKLLIVVLVSCFVSFNASILKAQGPCSIDLDPNTPGMQNDAAAAGLTITDVDLTTNYYNASPYTTPGSTGGAASVTINDGTEFCDEDGNGVVTGLEEGADIIINIPVPTENALSCADGTLEICLRGDFNNACEVAFIADAAGNIIAQSTTTGNPACAGPATCLDVIIPGCDLKADAADGMLTFEIRTNGDINNPGATPSGDQVDDTCTGAGSVDETGDGNPDGNCITFESFVWPTDNTDDFTLACPDAITIEGCTTDDINEGNAGFGYSTEEVDITDLDNALVITGCTPESITYMDSEPVEGDCPFNFTITRTFTVTVPCEEVPMTCTQDITVDDTTPPTVICPDNVAGLDCNTTELPDVMAMADDNCSTPENITIEFVDDLGLDEVDFCAGGMITRTYTATDECGNVSAPCMMTFTFDPDITPPEITCPDPVDVACGDPLPPGATNIGAFLDLPGASAMDNCSETFTVAFEDDMPIDVCVDGPITRTYTIADECGNEATCMQTINVEGDTTPPTLSEMPPDETLTCNEAIPAIVPVMGDDECSGLQSITFEEIDDMGVCPAPRIITRTWTAIDECGNETIYTQTITVDPDTEAPVITPPILDADTYPCPADVPPPPPADVTDNCDPDDTVDAVVTDNGGTGCMGDPLIFTYTYDYTDVCGNAAAPVVLTVTVEDMEPLTITCPADETVACEADIAEGTATFTAACMLGATITAVGPTLVTGDANCPDATYEIVYTVTDDCMRTAECTQTFTIANDPPMITCPADETVVCAADIMEGTPEVTTSCELGFEVTTVGPTLTGGTDNCNGATYEIVYTATDDCGRTAECTQVFTLNTDDPSIACPADETVTCLADIMESTADFVVACELGGEVTAVGPTLTSGTDDCPGATYEIVYTLTDACMNTIECTQVFTIANDPPTITCPADETVTCEADIAEGVAEFTTSCMLGGEVTTAGPTLTAGDADCPDATYEIVYTVTDDCGRTADCTQVFTIANDPPTITCPVDETVACEADIAEGVAEFTTSCMLGGEVTTVGPTLTAGTMDCPDATYEIVYTVTDDCGRTADCTQIFTIANDPPTITCPPDDPTVYPTDAGIPPADITLPTVTSSCNLGTTITWDGDVVDPECPNADNQATVTRTYTVTDDCGRTASCTQIFLYSCCDAVAGMLAPIENVCVGETITTTVDGTEAPAPDYGYDYVLTDAAGMIISGPQGNGTFTPTAPGDYCVYGVNYQTATGMPDYSSGDINTITHPSNCFEITNTCFTVGDIPMATIEACPNGPAPTQVLTGLVV